MKMIKKIIFLLIISVTVVTNAQETSGSVYSFYGLGDLKHRGTHDITNMGGLSVLKDSMSLNILNPASYANLKLTTFTIGGTSKFTNQSDASSSDSQNRTSYDYLAVGIPMGKAGAAFGLMPYSAVGYKIQKNSLEADGVTERANQYVGSGNINRIFMGGAYNILKGLNAGLNISYNFGEVTNKNTAFISGVQFPTRELNTSYIKGVSYDVGLMYDTKIGKSYNLYGSFNYTPSSTLDSENSRSIATIIYGATGTEFVNDELDINVSNSTLHIPATTVMAVGIGKTNKWMFGGQLTAIDNSKTTNRFSNNLNASYKNGQRITIGGFFIPKYDSFTSYLSRVTYSAGLRFENSGLVINNQDVKDFGINFGLGLPLGLSKINVGFEYGQQGTTTNGLVQEDYYGVRVGFSFADKWFRKRKID